MDMKIVDTAFNEIREILKSTVPPCQVTIDKDYHYEVKAIKKDKNGNITSDKIFGYVIKHDDSITIGFDTALNDTQKTELFSDYLIHKMNRDSRIRIHEMTHSLHKDLQYAIEHLLRYYTSMSWI